MYIHTDWWFMPQRIGDRVLLSTGEAVEVSGLSRVHIQRLLRFEQLEGVKLGHDWLVFEDSLTKYMAQPRKPGPKSKSINTTSQSQADSSSSTQTHQNSNHDAQPDKS